MVLPLLAALSLLLPLPSHLHAQTILNTERFQVEDADGYHVNADVSFAVERGNSEVVNVSTSGIVGTVSGSHWPRVIFGGRYLSDEERAILDDQFLQVRYSYLLTSATRTFHFVQVQKNETLLLRSRWLVGSGMRWTLHESERAQIALGTGVMGEWERLSPARLDPGEARETEALRLANVGVASWKLEGGATALNILYLQPDVGHFGDVRILNDLAIVVPVSEHFGTTIAFEWRRDSRPPGALERDDLTLRAGFTFDFP